MRNLPVLIYTNNHNITTEFFKLSIQQMKAVTTQDEQIMWARYVLFLFL